MEIKDDELLASIQNLKQVYPDWGYRKIWEYLRYQQGILVNKKRIYRLMKENNLLLIPITKTKTIKDYSHKTDSKTPTLVKAFGLLSLFIIFGWLIKKIIRLLVGNNK